MHMSAVVNLLYACSVVQEDVYDEGGVPGEDEGSFDSGSFCSENGK
jgi:hypothetical protein